MRTDAISPARAVPAPWKVKRVTGRDGELPGATPRTIVPAPEALPAETVVWQDVPAGKRSGSRFPRVNCTMAPRRRASPPAGKAGDTLGFSPDLRESGASSETPTQPPARQESNLVAAFPSSQVAAFAVCTHPVMGLHESSVHTFPSLQSIVAPGTQAPPEQESPVVQTLPSLQGTPSAVAVVPVQTPFAHASPPVQVLPSLHGIVLFVCWQPLMRSHESLVQTLPSLQLIAVPTHVAVPPVHLSPVVQTLPSLQAVPAGSILQVAEQPSPSSLVPSSHCSVTSRTPLPQIGAILPMRVPKRFDPTLPPGSPGPSMRKKF